MHTCAPNVPGSVLTEEGKERLKWLEKNCGNNHPDVQQVILEHGGDAVCIYLEEDAEKIKTRGQYFPGGKENVLMRKGVPCQCHYNSSRLWARHRNYKLCTGYALSYDSDGIKLWRQHSWCINAKGQIVETTSLREAYFGFVMTQEEAELFEFENM